MRIEWLNEDCTEAVVTCGRLWWRRQAHVRWLEDSDFHAASHSCRWEFVPSGNPADEIGTDMTYAMRAERGRKKQEMDWVPVRGLPKAKALDTPAMAKWRIG